MDTQAPNVPQNVPLKADYKSTLNLPRTDFPMKADLVKNEPARLAKWKASDLYARVQDAHKHNPSFILHDGPPFANGDIHIGHVINKTLKDIVLKYKTMAGHRTPYVPGWDCHGLPIEHKIQEEIGPKWREMEPLAIREKCFAWASGFIAKQSEQFERLGIFGNWAEPYATMAPTYEAGTLEVFARFVERGLVYKQLKPVTWSIENGTALADAELEYKDVVDTSVFVEFPAANPGAIKAKFDLRVNAKVNFLIWTTTPWTLPANLAIAVGPDVDYAFVQFERAGEQIINVIAKELVEAVFRRVGVDPSSAVRIVKGRELEGADYLHPFVDRTGKIVLADYVTTTDGTGLVHTAPGHGEEDYETGNKYALDVYCPVQANGKYDSTVPSWLAGLNVWPANPIIIEKLKEIGVLFAAEKYSHSYPHDWRSKKPTITRATEQWFVAVDKPFHLVGDYGGSAGEAKSIRARGLEAVRRDVKFYPDWGQARLAGMLESRPDWCVSRQRAWGLPIPVFYNESGDALITPESVRAVASTFATHGSNAWFSMTPAQLLGEDFDAGEGFDLTTLRKERDIFDVWFESGSSWFSVVEARSTELGHVPVDLYLEGSDQHRGWFQLSSLTALGVTGNPPFKAALTHGFAVKPDGTKVSKSDKEYVKAVDEINRHGADVLRLWVASIDYQGDMPVSPKTLADFGDKYRKLRNTIRYLLSNIDDFEPLQHSLPIPEESLDRWMMNELGNLSTAVRDAYDGYKFHIAFRLLHDFCAVQISSVYGNAMKDRLYCERPDSPIRRRAQLVMYECAVALIQLLAPMCPFTSDEAWEFLKAKPQELPSVHLSRLPEPHGTTIDEPDAFRLLMRLRDEALLQLDGLKKSIGLNKAGEAEAVYTVKTPAQAAELRGFGVDLEDLVGCGYHSIVVDAGLAERPTVTIVDRRAEYALCARSWKRRPDVGSDGEFPELSKRDADAMRAGRLR